VLTVCDAGLPNPSYFPYDTLEAKSALPDRFKPTPNAGDKAESAQIVVPHLSKTGNPFTQIDLTTALQYGQASGYPPLLSFIRQFTLQNLHPNIPYKDGADVVLTCGSTDGFSKTIECFTNVFDEENQFPYERQGILCEEFAYMNAIQACAPRGLNVVPVKIDADGMLVEGKGALRDVLENWDASRGKRPHLMYTVT
jgi:DNA-binding transcriptional MocR family regulator